MSNQPSSSTPVFKTPGQLIQHLLDERKWTQAVLSTVLGVDQSTLNKIIAGKRALEAKLAIGLSEIFGVQPEQFMDLQKSFELAEARMLALPDPERATRAHLFGNLPIPEMIKRGWLDVENARDSSQVEGALAKFFGTTSASEIEFLPHASKKTDVSGDVTPAQLSWLYRVKQIAGEMLVGRYTPAEVEDAINKLSLLLASPTEIRKVSRILAEAGIRFVVVESLTGAKIDGVCLWLNDEAPVIAMTLRYDRIDNFWFVLRHEIEHVRRGHGRDAAMLDTDLEGEKAGTGQNIPEEERVANQAAADFCVPQRELRGFISRKAPFFAERDILGFARTLNVHPGLVAGQLQHATKSYNKFRNHLVKIRSIVTAPGTMVDGWGDIAPVED